MIKDWLRGEAEEWVPVCHEWASMEKIKMIWIQKKSHQCTDIEMDKTVTVSEGK